MTLLNLQAFVGLCLFIGFSFLLSESRKNISWKLVVIGLSLQFFIGILCTRFAFIQSIMGSLNEVVQVLSNASTHGTTLVFGYLTGVSTPFEVTKPHHSFILAFQALPLILFMSALSALLYHWKLLPALVQLTSFLLQKFMKISGALSVGVAANIFVGMVEAPLLIKPYLLKLSRSELLTLMTCGMATIAGTVMALYAAILSSTIPDVMGHIVSASLMSAPAALIISHIFIPETQVTSKIEKSSLFKRETQSAVEAITNGTREGISLLLNVIAMLIVFTAFVYLINQALTLIPHKEAPHTLESLLGYLMTPVAWCMGIPSNDIQSAGSLIGIKTILNEFLAYLQLAELDSLTPRSRIILTYALCGFANFSSLGIMLGGLTQMAPERKTEIVQLGLKSILTGTISTLITGSIIGILV